MVSMVSAGLVFVLCVVLLPEVTADHCYEYESSYGEHQEAQDCGYQYCCGKCSRRYCCTLKKKVLLQDSCGWSHSEETFPAGGHFPIGPVLGGIFFLILVVSVIVCCVAPCCICYKICRKRRNTQAAVVNTFVHPPQQPNPTIYQPTYPGYNPVPAQPGYMGPPSMPAAPPTYTEATDPRSPSAAFFPGQPMYPLRPVGASHPQQGPEDQKQPPYNPSYNPGF